MERNLLPYGANDSRAISMVGKLKASASLADRMPTTELAAKVGRGDGVSTDERVVIRRNAAI